MQVTTGEHPQQHQHLQLQNPVNTVIGYQTDG